MVHALDNIENDKSDYITFIMSVRNMMHEVNAGDMSPYEVINKIDSFIGQENEVEQIIYESKKIQNLLWDQKEQVSEKLKEAIVVMNDARLSFSGYVSNDIAIQKLDNFLGDYKEFTNSINSKEVTSDETSEIEQLEKSCSELSNVSQKNYQLAKKYKKVLDAIVAPKYGLQGIMEDYSDHDSPEYLKELLAYYRDLSQRYENLARQSLK